MMRKITCLFIVLFISGCATVNTLQPGTGGSTFEIRGKNYDEIWFYHNPGRFHNLYRRLLNQSKLKDRIVLFSHVYEIG